MNAIDLQSCLIANGHLARLQQLKGQSISDTDRRIMMRIRKAALAAGFCQRTINATEMWGEQGGERPSGHIVDAEFIGMETMTRLKTRLYNIEGFHRLSGSTVGVRDLVHNWILPRDISMIRIAWEYAKETILLIGITHA